METTRQEPATLGLFVRLEANPGREDDVAAFLVGALALVREEPATTTWFAVRMGPATFGIFDTFPDEAGRQAHLEGRVAAGLKETTNTVVTYRTSDQVAMVGLGLALAAGILNLWRMFAVPAFAPVLLNLVLIAVLLATGAVGEAAARLRRT